MKVDVLLGLQWGDEGKGKIVDVLAPHYDIIARFQGGPNAGHTIIFEGNKKILHTIPSGIFHRSKKNLIGNGVIIDPLIFEKEYNSLLESGIDARENLVISKRAHLILPTHILLDIVYEKSKGEQKIGSTLKGIGPTYTDKVGRNGIRVGEITEDYFESKYLAARDRHLRMATLFCANPLEETVHGMSFKEYEQRWHQALNLLKTIESVDSEYFINDSLKQGKRVLAEGAQGTLLDIDFGSYPFVTSSNTITAGVCAGLGIPPSAIDKVFGVFKAYCTRVGSGPFPTELFDETGEMLRKTGHEFGSTTGRPRRCGWLDLPALKFAIMLNGVTHLLMMKADVLNEMNVVNICTGYKTRQGFSDRWIWDVQMNEIEPVYHQIKGWENISSQAEKFDDLPNELIKYMEYIEKETGIEIPVISIGPERNRTIIKSGFTG